MFIELFVFACPVELTVGDPRTRELHNVNVLIPGYAIRNPQFFISYIPVCVLSNWMAI